jgi:hypothetical protein
MKSTALAAALLTLAGPALAQNADADWRRCRQLTDPAGRLACYDGLATLPAAPPASAAAASFGLPRPADEIQEVVTRYEGLFEGWSPGDRIRLANGQVWQIADDSRAVYRLRDPKVTVRRGALGRFVLDVEGARITPTVRRVE